MSTDRQMDKELVVYIHNGILLSHKKEHIWVSSNEVDETGSYYIEWSKSERTAGVAQMVKSLSTMRETCVRSLDREDPLEKEMATHSSSIAWKIPWMEEPGRLQSMGSQRVRHDWATSLSSQVRKRKDKYCMCSVTSVVSDSLQSMDWTPQTPLSVGFSRQEYWRGLLCPPPGKYCILNAYIWNLERQ